MIISWGGVKALCYNQFMNIVTISAFLSTILSIYCLFPYIAAILKNKTKPHQLSWLVFVIMNGIVLFSQYFEGARASILITAAFFIGSVIIFILSLKYGVRDSSQWDRVLFIFAILTIVIWYVTKSNATAIWLTLLIDIAATTMILLKVKADSHSEDPAPWAIATVAYVFSCLTLVGQPVSILYVRPVYGLICDAVLVGYIYYQKSKNTKDIL